MRPFFVLTLALHALFAQAAEPSAQALSKMMVTVMEETKVNLRTGIAMPVAEFKSDGDPHTLEIVLLEKSEPGANTVSDDGEVIFLFEPTDAIRGKLIAKAFEIRAKRRLAT